MRKALPKPEALWTKEDARRVLDEWKQLGGTLSAFARSRGIAIGRLYWWKSRLGDPARPRRTPSFVPAMIVGNDPGATIRLPTGVTIELTSATPGWVAAMIAELTRSA